MGGVAHYFESEPTKGHFSSNFWAEDFDVIFSHNMPDRYELAEINFTEITWNIC
jgi:hypothetical protein